MVRRRLHQSLDTRHWHINPSPLAPRGLIAWLRSYCSLCMNEGRGHTITGLGALRSCTCKRLANMTARQGPETGHATFVNRCAMKAPGHRSSLC